MALALVPVVILVEPAAAAAPGPSLTLKTSGGIIRDGSVISTGTSMTTAVGGLLAEGTGTRELRIDLDEGTVYEAGGVTAPEGWTIEWSTDAGANWVSSEPGTASDVTNVRASATVDAGPVNGSSQTYTKALTSPVPASTFSGSTGGDGWDVFFYDDYVLNIFHHQATYVAMDCHLRSTGARCTGFDPTQTSGAAHSRFSGYMAANRSGGWVDGNTGFAYVLTADNNSGSPTRYTPGALCIDLNVAPPTNCGFTALSSNTNVSNYGVLSNAEGAGGRLFGMESTNADLLCFDPATNAACAGSPVALSGGTDTAKYHVYPLGTKVFASTDTDLYCFEASDLSSCGGSWPVSYTSLSWTSQRISPVAHMDASGTIDGVCMWNGCLDLTGAERTDWVNPHSITPWSASAGTNSWSGQYGRFEATSGRAYLHEVLKGTATTYCFDYATEAACTGFNTSPIADIYVYALRADPNNPACLWYNSDPGKIGLFDAFTGASECSANPVITLQPSAFAPRFVCTTSGGIDRWKTLTLDSVSGGTPASQTLTVRTGNGDAVDGWVGVPITIGETLPLSDLTVAASGARPTFNITFSGVTGGALTAADFTIDYEGRGPELCVDVTVDNTAVSGSPNCPVVQSIVGTLSENVTGPVAATALSRSFTASGSTVDCPENILYAGPPGPVVDLAGSSPTTGVGAVTFKPPTDDGGSPIRWYELSTDGGSTWAVVANEPDGGGQLNHQLTGMTPGPYTFEVRAVNLLGAGPATDTAVSVLAAPPPTTTTAPPPTAPPTTEPTTTTTESTTTTRQPATTTPAPTVIPVRNDDGDLPDLDPGESRVFDDGDPVEVTVEVVGSGRRTLEIASDDGVILQLEGDCAEQCEVKEDDEGKPYLLFEQSGRVVASGEGFLPGSKAHVWLMSDPTYLGFATVGIDGTFEKFFDVTVDPGEHTLQVNGTTAAGAERSANIGLVVLDGPGSGANQTGTGDGTGSGSGDADELAYTGSNWTYVYVGLGLLALGATFVFVARRFSSMIEE